VNEFMNKVMDSIQDYCSESSVLLTGGLLREDADQGRNVGFFDAKALQSVPTLFSSPTGIDFSVATWATWPLPTNPL